MDTSACDEFAILIPAYNDWAALGKVLPLLGEALAAAPGKSTFRVIVADDGSSDALPASFPTELRGIRRLDILRLRRNLGHQRAIAIGLSYIEAQIPCRAAVVMDGDGEDKPTDVPVLIAQFTARNDAQVVFAARARRTERLSFRIFYRLYRGAHLLLTGERVRVGNFSVISRAHLTQMVCVSDLWNHYAASVIKTRLPLETVPLARGYRVIGQSRMNFVSLVVHGLSAMSVYGDRIGVRILAALSIAMLVSIGILFGMLIAHFGFGVFLPNWMKTAALILLLIIPEMLLISLIFVFIVLEGRGGSAFLPCREYPYFVSGLEPRSSLGVVKMPVEAVAS